MPRYNAFEYTDLGLEISIDKYTGSATSVTIPSRIDGLPVTSIGEKAFSGCSSLESINIPKGVTFIGAWTFNDCKSLKTIYFPRALMGVNGRNNTLNDFRSEYNNKIRYY